MDESSKKNLTWPKEICPESSIPGNRRTTGELSRCEASHFTDMLKGKDFAVKGKSPANTVVALWLNDRSSNHQETLIRN